MIGTVSTTTVRQAQRLLIIAVTMALLSALVGPAAEARAWKVWLVPADQPIDRGARVMGQLPLTGALVVTSPTRPAFGVAADTPLGWHSRRPERSGDALRGVYDTAARWTRAPRVWEDGVKGQHTVVAVIDTGVAPIAALDGAVAGEVDFTGTGGGDGYGHGTFMASLIASRSRLQPGIAPEAGILSLKVGDADGSTDLSTLLGALHWLHGPGRALGVRVAVLALGVDPGTPAAELLDLATERLAESGVLVVTAAGNGGEGDLTSPGTSPGTFAAGAIDDGGTVDRSDDTSAAFSGTGQDRLGVEQPDVYAPGASVVGSISDDSIIAHTYKQEDLPQDLFVGSGTSMSAALTAGVAALASSARTDVGGATLEAALRRGGSMLDAQATVAAVLDAPDEPGQRAEEARGGERSEDDRRDRASSRRESERSRGDGAHWTAAHWSAAHWTAAHWTGSFWQASDWAAEQWNAAHWTGAHWTAAHWTAAHWTAAHWTAAHWTAAHWTAAHWTGGLWRAPRWQAAHWTGAHWSAAHWTAAHWTAAHWTGAHWTLVEPGDG